MVSATDHGQQSPPDHRIRPYRVPVAIIFQTKMETAQKSGSFLIVEGTTRCLFEQGMEFYCDRKLDDQRLCVYLDHPESEHKFFEVEVLRTQRRSQKRYRYTVMFRRMLNTAELEDFDNGS